MKLTTIDALERRATVLAHRAQIQRAEIHRSVIARLTEPATLATAAAVGAIAGWHAPRESRARRTQRRRGGRLLRAFDLANRYSGPLLSLVAWLIPACTSTIGRPRTTTPR